jgi:hypothetical protein
VECCIPDPNRPEGEEELLARAKKIHPDKEFPSPLPANLTRFSNPNRQKRAGE